MYSFLIVLVFIDGLVTSSGQTARRIKKTPAPTLPPLDWNLIPDEVKRMWNTENGNLAKEPSENHETVFTSTKPRVDETKNIQPKDEEMYPELLKTFQNFHQNQKDMVNEINDRKHKKLRNDNKDISKVPFDLAANFEDKPKQINARSSKLPYINEVTDIIGAAPYTTIFENNKDTVLNALNIDPNQNLDADELNETLSPPKKSVNVGTTKVSGFDTTEQDTYVNGNVDNLAVFERDMMNGLGRDEDTHGMQLNNDHGYVWNKISPNHYEYKVGTEPIGQSEVEDHDIENNTEAIADETDIYNQINDKANTDSIEVITDYIDNGKNPFETNNDTDSNRGHEFDDNKSNIGASEVPYTIQNEDTPVLPTEKDTDFDNINTSTITDETIIDIQSTDDVANDKSGKHNADETRFAETTTEGPIDVGLGDKEDFNKDNETLDTIAGENTTQEISLDNTNEDTVTPPYSMTASEEIATDENSPEIINIPDKATTVSENIASESLHLNDLLNNEEFWQWLSSWTSTYMEIMNDNIKAMINEEVAKQLEEMKYSNIESNDIEDGSANVDTTKPESNEATENPAEPSEETFENSSESDIPKKVNAETIYGNSVNSDQVTNIFIFSNNKPLQDVKLSVGNKDIVISNNSTSNASS